jgi:hypothetical protein
MTPPPKQNIWQWKMYYPNWKLPPQIKKPKKKYFTINFLHLIHKAHQILLTFTSVLHLHGQCLHLTHTHTHTLLTFPSSSLPFHNISSVPFTAVDIQHFLKHFMVEMYRHAHDPLAKWYIYSSRLIIILEPWRFKTAWFCITLHSKHNQHYNGKNKNWDVLVNLMPSSQL